MAKKPTMLMIWDGFGITDKVDGNAVAAANKPNFDKYWGNYPHTTLGASGMAVGLPEGQMGNSEVGHLNIGAGRVVYQSLTKVTKSILDKDFFEKEALVQAVNNAKANGGALHLMGLLSPGGVHSHTEHVKGLVDLAKVHGLEKLYIHAFTDGRDVPPSSAKEYVEELESYMNEQGVGKFATVSGRYYAMDRDNRWERVQLAYDAMVNAKGEFSKSALEAIDKSYHDNKTDEFILPTVIIDEENKPVAKINKNDSVVFFNFRPDRAREMTKALTQPGFDGFEREDLNLFFVTMTEYDSTFTGLRVVFGPEEIKNTLGEVVAANGLNQLRIAETEKYAHVTFFFNGGVEEPNPNEDRALIPSPKVATYDLQPQMSAPELTEQLLAKLDEDKYDMIILNFANPDMVGHTGIFEAAKAAVEAVDACAGKIVDKVLEKDGAVFITADHGNAETMIDYSNGKPFTAHTTEPVPFVFIANNAKALRDGGSLADIAPTMLEVMGVAQPADMTGKSLIVK
ncbi:2,3-bisphosphoglycerate-independent phosphoglycerate mutase [Clostridium cellulovorans]|uniref:2,3-bisphosphoglycerate-independent phosphoglycerate mutase n=1 Tax=Clostridium cellulovorans (strain ATCC 35296 / DSM 3052 / OCM 3 / 743B) TaxID=573061 RepID=D9SRX6_CLOC7|nr:2,3-bisphosphoglycerate-independent phosphoglycerate mutase [Clostridium cellulovorans]ADL50493.1 phosphoglycerate mutase, 2,3-bisphosphoglycerate-independent [Clostridium cellulovorans 743B]